MDVIRVNHPPAKPTLHSSFRLPALGIFVGGGGMGMWWAAAQAAATTPLGLTTPTTGQMHMAATLGAAAIGAGAAAAGVRHYRWRVAMEDQRTYEAIARVLRLPADQRARRMKVKARDGMIPREVRVRVDSVNDARDDRARRNLVRAFADATGEPVERVRMQTVKRAVRLWVEAPAEVHEPDSWSEAEPDEEPSVAPVPARPADDRTAERVTAAMQGALGDKGVSVTITETHDSGAPAEVWVEYPPALTASILGALQSVRDTMERVHHARNDEWTVRWVSARDRIVLTDRVDPLARIVDLPDVRAEVDLHKGVQVGITESGSPWLIPLMGGNHTLVAGASGSGKGSVLWNVLRGVEPLVKDGRCRIWLIDPKGGMELGPAEHVATGFAVTPEDSAAMLERVREYLQGKAARLRHEGRRKIEVPTTDEPLDLVIVDELANATSLGGPAGKAVGEHIAALCSMGRAPAVTVIGAVQDPRKETFKHRGLFTHAVALRMSEANETNLILGQGARAQGAIADMIPKQHPGIGYVIRDGHAGHERVRAAYVSDEEIEATVRRMERPLPPPPIGNPIPETYTLEVMSDESEEPVKVVQLRDPVRIAALSDFPVRAQFDGDPDPVTIHGWEFTDEPGRLLVSYCYDGGPASDTDVDEGETVTVLA